VNSPEDIELSLVIIHRVAVPDGRDLTLLLQPAKLIVGKAEAPKVIESASLSLATKDINIAAITRHRSAYPGRRSI
jgi:hypothetical protein